MGVVDEDMDSFYKKSTWELVNLSKVKKTIRCKWVFRWSFFTRSWIQS